MIGNNNIRVLPRGVAAAPPATHWWLAPSGGMDTIPAANCIAAYDAKNAASLAASYDNLAAPGNGLLDGTYDCALGVAPNWANGTGWTGTGTQWLNTNVIPTNQYSIIVRFFGITSNHIMGGSGAGGSGYLLWPRWNGDRRYTNISTLTITSGAITAGIMCVAGSKAYLNGLDNGNINNAGAVGTWSIYILAYNTLPIPAIFAGGVAAMAIYNIPIGTYIVALNAAMAAL